MSRFQRVERLLFVFEVPNLVRLITHVSYYNMFGLFVNSFISFQVTGTTKKFVYNCKAKQECVCECDSTHFCKFSISLDERGLAHLKILPILF